MNIFQVECVLAILIGYLLGSIPFAHIFVKISTGLDIRKVGSGNVGAMNSFDVTGKKRIGVIVMLLDLTKGFLACLIAFFLVKNSYCIAITGIAAVLGHNYSAFLKFKGGRGLATAAGISLFINPIMLVFWAIYWNIGYISKKDIIKANLLATIMTPITVLLVPTVAIDYLMFIGNFDKLEYSLFTFFVCIIILLGHLQPIKDLISPDRDAD